MDPDADHLLRTAIADKRLVSFLYEGCRRLAEPHDYGILNGDPRLFYYQRGGKSRSGEPIGWRWAMLERMSKLRLLEERFGGSRPTTSGRHNKWDYLIASVSERARRSERRRRTRHGVQRAARPGRALTGAVAARQDDLHGNAPDKCPLAVLLIDFINDFEFSSAERVFPRALVAAKATAALVMRARKAAVPVVYVNDNFGRWRSDFRSLLEHCMQKSVRGQPIAELLKPQRDDYFVLKPKHSGFQFTTLHVLLQHLGARTLILTGVAGNFCVLFTAHDAYMRDFKLVVPSDCIASETDADDRHALEHMAKVVKADTRPSSGIDFARLSRER